MGNTDRQQSDSGASADGKRTTCMKKKRQVLRRADRQEEKERGQGEKWAKRERGSPLLFGFWLPASSSINSSQENGVRGKGEGNGEVSRRTGGGKKEGGLGRRMVEVVKTDGAEDRKDKAKIEGDGEKKGDRDGWSEQEGERGGRGVWRYIIEEMEQREGQRRQELTEKPVTGVLLMCNESLHPERETTGRTGRQGDARMEGEIGKKGEEEEE